MPSIRAHSTSYVPVPLARRPLQAQQRIAISPQTHARLVRIASKRFRGNGSLSKLGCAVLHEYLNHMERVYFGAPGAKACLPVPSSARDYDAVVFDMDGVLCDSEMASRQAAVATFRKFYNTEVQPEDFAPFTGTGEANFLHGVAKLYNVQGFDPEEAKQKFFEVYIKYGYISDLLPFRGIPNLVERVKSLGLKVAVASAADAIKVEANLNAIGLPPSTFDFTTSSDDIENKKPAPDVFLAAAKGLGVQPERCVVIEDAVAGVQAALAAGMRCVAVSTSLPAENLEKAGADVVREEPALIEIADLFGKDVFADVSKE